MSNGIRHLLGGLLGLVAVPAIFGLLNESVARQQQLLKTFQTTGPDHTVQIACFAGVAAIVGVAVGSRISPLTSLVPGLVFAGVGALFAAQPNNTSSTSLPPGLRQSYATFGASGLFLMLGGVLLVASLFPGRWRRPRVAAPAAAGRHSYDYDYENGNDGDTMVTPQQPGYDDYAGGAPALQYGDQLYSQNPDYKPGFEGYQPERPPAFGRRRDEPERPGWANPPPGPSPFS